jgi:glycosyltransferase involved in cell wall biosynthesis
MSDAELPVEGTPESSTTIPTLSIVIPLLNEEESLRPLYTKIRAMLDTDGIDGEILFIDDGSNDSSWSIVAALASDDTRVRGIRFRRNFGKSAGLATGFRAAKGDIVITMDADLQDDPDEIPNLLAKLSEGYDLVTGWKQVRHDPITKRWPSKVFNWLTCVLSGIRLHDFNCGLKAYRRVVTDELRMTRGMHRFTPALAHMRGFRVTEIPVLHHARQFGRSKYGAKRFIDGMLDLMTVLLLTRYLTRPLRFFGWIGMTLVGSGMAIGAYIAYLRIAHGWIMNRHPLLWLGILLILVGLQLLSTGLLAELIASTRSSDGDASVSEIAGIE